ncbi:MAG: glutamine synthetase family protein [Pseudomonadota bacterium]
MESKSEAIQQEVRDFHTNYPDVVDVDLYCMDICGNIFGKRYPLNQLAKLAAEGVKLPRAMPLVSAKGIALEVGKYGHDDGDPDQLFFPVAGTLCAVPWANKARAQMLISTSNTQVPLAFEPRVALTKVLDRFSSAGRIPRVAFELEFYLVDAERDDNGKIRPPFYREGKRDDAALLTLERLDRFGDCFDDIVQCCKEQGVETGALSAEMGPGQYEINLMHSDDALAASDHCLIFRRTVIEVARLHGLQATFMAKPYIDHAGNGQHLHISLYDTDGMNILHEQNEARLTNAVGGCLELLRPSMAIFAPNVNSYRRFVSDNSVALRASWGRENRTVAIRIPDSDANNLRLEHRVSGADSNPYLTLAFILAGIDHGLSNEICPPEPCDENASESGDLPSNLREALSLFRKCAPLINCFGIEFVNTYYLQKISELAEFEYEIGAREYDWYL